MSTKVGPENYYIPIPGSDPKLAEKESQPAVKGSQPADTSLRSILAGSGTLIGAFLTAAGVSMLTSTTATVVKAGIAFTTVGAVATVAGATFLLYKWYKS